MSSGCGILIAGRCPSSARQLPILAALYARVPTLFTNHNTGYGGKRQYIFSNFRAFACDLEKVEVSRGNGAVVL